MFKTIRTMLTTLLLSVSFYTQANIITFDNWHYNSHDNIDWQVSIDDESHNDYFTFTISIGNIDTIGDILGFAFDSTAHFDLNSDLVNYSPHGFSSFATDSVRCGSGCNFNGAIRNNFDHIFKVGQQGAGSDYVTEFSFGLASNGLTLDENLFTRVAIRAQSVGSDCDNSRCNGSVKDYSDSRTTEGFPNDSDVVTPDVPEPGPLMLLALSLFALATKRAIK